MIQETFFTVTNKIAETPLYLFISILLLGSLLTVVVQKLVSKVLIKISAKAPLIKKYWRFVVPFAGFSLVTYFLVILFSEPENIGSNLNALGQLLTLFFAVFVGHSAFQQVEENRFDKLATKGREYLQSSSFPRAIQYYEEAHSINPEDFSVLSELIEVYVANQDYQKFDEKIALLEGLKREDREEIVICYLKIARFLFKQELGDGKKEIGNFLESAKKNPALLKRPGWDFRDILKSDAHEELVGESRITLDNFIKYLDGKLSDEERTKFEEGNFTLKEV